MSQHTQHVTCEHIISSLKTLGFSVKRINENLISLHNGEHTIRVSRGALDVDREVRMRRELAPIFAYNKEMINSSADANLQNVRDWLEASTAKIRNR